MYPGQHMSVEDNIFYAKRNIGDSIWKEATIEGIDITFPATKAVFEGAKYGTRERTGAQDVRLSLSLPTF